MHTLSPQPLTRIPPSFFFLSYLQHFPSLAFCRRKRSKQNTFLFLVYLRRFRFHRHHDLIKSPDWLVIVPWRQNWEKTLFDWIISTCTMPPPTFHPPPTHVSISLFFPFYFSLSLIPSPEHHSIFLSHCHRYLFLLLFISASHFFLLCRCSFSSPSIPYPRNFLNIIIFPSFQKSFFLLIFTRYKFRELLNVESYFW